MKAYLRIGLLLCLSLRGLGAQPLEEYLTWYPELGLDSLYDLRLSRLQEIRQANDSLALARWTKDVAADQVRYHADYQTAAELNQRAIAWAARLGDDDLHSACLNNQGIFHMQLGQYAQATAAYQQSLALTRQMNDSISLAKNLHNLGNLFLYQQDYAAAMPYYREALRINRRLAAWRSAGKNLQSIANTFAQRNLHDSAKVYALQILALSAAQDTLQIGSQPWLLMGDLYNETNQPDSAFWYYTQSLEKAKAEQSLQNMLRTLHALGKWHIYQEEFEAARDRFHEGLRRMGDRQLNLRLYLLGGLGMAYKRLGQLDSARQFYRQALALTEQWQQPRPRLTYLSSLANLERRNGHPEQAVALLRPLLTDSVTIVDPYWQGKVHCELGLALAALGQWTESVPMLEKAIPQARQYGEWEDLRAIHGTLAERAATQGRASDVLRHMTQRQRWQDSIQTQRYAENLAELRTRYETDLKTQQLDQLSLQQALTAASLNRTRRARNGLVAVVVALLLIGVGVGWLMWRLQKQRRQIEQQRLRLQTLNQTKDRLFALIAHDLAGPVASFEELNRLYQYYLRQGRTEPLHELGEQVARQSQQLRLLLDNLLQWAMQQMQAYRPRPEAVDLSVLLHEQTAFFEARAKEKGLTLRVNAPDTLSWHGDAKGLRIVLTNLLANAVKFSEQGSVVVSVTQGHRALTLSVADQGPGMSEERMAEVLQGEMVHPRAGSQGEKGAGLGLAFVQRWVRQQGGEMKIRSQLGEGLMVEFEI